MSENARRGPILDSHFHWYPQVVKRAINESRGLTRLHSSDWSDLDAQLQRMDDLGRRVDVISSTGPFAGLFTNTDPATSRRLTRLYNETMAEGQRQHPGRVWGTCVIPLLDTDDALAELEYSINTLGLVGVNVPGRIGATDNLDEPRLEAFYDRIEELGVPVLIHPNDEAFQPVLEGYDGALPFQAGRMDKNSGAAKLPQPPSAYLKRMYTDTVSPHTLGVAFAVEFYGADRVIYGSDYPCWDPDAALRIIDELDLDDDSYRKITDDNARRLYGIRDRAGAAA